MAFYFYIYTIIDPKERDFKPDCIYTASVVLVNNISKISSLPLGIIALANVCNWCFLKVIGTARYEYLMSFISLSRLWQA